MCLSTYTFGGAPHYYVTVLRGFARLHLWAVINNGNSLRPDGACTKTVYTASPSRGSSVGTVSDYGLDGRGSIPDTGRGFSL
jgi:hypothetical protein